MEIRKSSNKEIKLRIGLSGVSGSGKTFSALLLAYGLTGDWRKIVVIDSENGSSNIYSFLGPYNVIKLEAPFSPENYIKAIKTAENGGMEVIIIDSITHEWKGQGGCLEIHKKLGGRFQDWGKVTPRHEDFLNTIHSSTCQLISTVRRRQKYLVDTNESGRLEVKKLGTKEETRNGFEYELTLNFELLGEQNLAKATKDRTSLFIGKPHFVINSTTGKKLKYWLETGKNLTKERAKVGLEGQNLGV